VLYISGDLEGRILFRRIAQRWETVKLLVADSGEEGIDLAMNRRPRMVVLDAHLSDLDGEEVVVALRREAMPPGTPIVVLGHNITPSKYARFVWAGASAYLTKPFNIAEIDRTVGELLEVAATR
jgi:DNA-binding response OmpR family regulator